MPVLSVLAEPLAAFLAPEELSAALLMRDRFNLDVTRTYQFWESAVARIVAGRQTGQGCPWDVELEHAEATIRIEVKFSQEFDCRFRAGVRQVFKFAPPKGAGGEKPSHVTVLLGIDADDQVHAWAMPSSSLPKCASITLTSPRCRRGGASRSPVEAWRCPPTQLLPEVLRSWRAHLAIGEELTRARVRHAELAESGQGALLEVPGVG